MASAHTVDMADEDTRAADTALSNTIIGITLLGADRIAKLIGQ